MKTIKQKIVKPFVWLIVITLLVIMLMFNVIMRFYAQNAAQKEIKNTMVSVQTLIRQQIISDSTGEHGGDTLLERLKLIRQTLKIASLSSSTEFVIINKDGNVLFPKDFEDSFLNDQVVQKSLDALLDKEEGQVGSFRQSGLRYYTTSTSYGLTNRLANFKLIFITSSSALWNVMRIVNLILFCIIVIATAVGIFITIRLSKHIAKPISDLSLNFAEIGNGNFFLLAENDSTKEINELTRSMNEMSKRLMDYDRTQKMFLQNASHEIRTPLMSIQGYAEGLAKGIFSDTAKTAEIICEESKRLNTLVEELLTLSRIENNTYEKELSVINLSDVMKEYIQKTSGYALKEGKTLTLNIIHSDIWVNANDTLLSAAVINIISNCIKYAKSEIVVSVYKQEGFAIIRICDDGEGISQKDLPHIFERFYKGKTGNFGLGLSIAKSATLFMGGSIKAYNDNGATFEIRLKSKER